MADSSAIRPVAALPIPDSVQPCAIGAPPEIILVEPSRLSIEASYQRDLTRRGVNLIHKLVSEWDWARFKPPVVCRVGDALHVIDGQHTAIAALTHGGIGRIPVLVVEAPEEQERAAAFLGHNRDRVQITSTQMFHASAAAGDEDALTVLQVCERAGATVLRNPSPGRAYKVGEVVAVQSLVALVRRRSAQKARVVVETLVKAHCAPIPADLIRAVDYVLHDDQYAGELDPDAVAATIMRLGIAAVEQKAVELALAKRMQRWRATAIVLFQNTRKRRGAG